MIDRWEGPSKPAVLKSFERGHSIRDDDAAKYVATDLEYWIHMYLPH